MSSPELRIDLREFDRNLAHVQATVAPAQLMLVVKDNAYAQGLEWIVRRAVHNGIDLFGSFDIPTGIAVRQTAGPHVRILAWQTSGERLIDEALAADIDLGVGDRVYLDRVAARAATAQLTARVQLKIDTGLHRNGVRPEQWREFLAQARSYEDAGSIRVVGIWSHIAEASDEDDDESRKVFEQAVALTEEAGFALEMRHLAASAASFERPEFRYDVVRIGAFCYGIRSADGPDEDYLGVHPISALRAQIARIDASGVVLNVGSLDGLPSLLARRCTITSSSGQHLVTAIGQDETTVVPWDDASVGEWVTVFGGGEALSATDLAEQIDTVGEEILLRVSPLVKRVYVE